MTVAVCKTHSCTSYVCRAPECTVHYTFFKSSPALCAIDEYIHPLCTGTNDEQGIFEDIKKTNASLLKDVSDRIFFVVNKMDSKKFCAGATKEETRGSVAARVTKAMAMPDFTLKAEQVSGCTLQLLSK